MSKAYHIKQWNPLYEKAETRKTDYMSWYPKRTKMIGRGIGKTMRQPYPQNMILRGLWGELEVLASLSPLQERGWLTREGVPLDAEAMSDLMPTIPPEAFQQALDWFSHPSIEWLEYIDCPFAPDRQEATGRNSQSSPDRQEATGRNSQSSPDRQEATGRNSATEREREREFTDRGETGEREALTAACRRVSAPSPEEVESWAAAAGIPAAFAIEKLAAALEREDFAKASVRKSWPARFTRFWKEDGAAWTRKNQKNRAPQPALPGQRPDGWMEGDQEAWWTGDLTALRGQLAGLAMMDKKTAGRLYDVIQKREQ